MKWEYNGEYERIGRDEVFAENKNGNGKRKKNHQKNLVIDIDDIWEYIVGYRIGMFLFFLQKKGIVH